MNSASNNSGTHKFGRHSGHLHRVRHAIFAGLCLLAIGLQAQTDNFDSGSDAAWSKITNSDYPATYSFPTDVFGGKAYRLQGGAYAGTNFTANAARVVAYRSDGLYTNFYVAADIVNWDSGVNNGQVFGVLARGTNISSGLVDAMIFGVRINRFRDTAGSRGQIFIYSLLVGDVGSPGAAGDCTLIPGRKYRFVFSGVGNVFFGAIYDLEDLTKPLVSTTGDDAYVNTGFAGPGFPTNSAGYVGVFNASLDGSDPTTDTTFDNFVAQELPPTNLPAPATVHGLRGAPQVVNRSPVSFSNFYPAANGITFNATTLTTTNAVNTNAIWLYLNGFNVSSGLSITGPTTNAAVSYNGLTSNAVYNARIELQDALGRKTTNIWTFDTFTDAYLAGPRSKNIECEDFNYSSDVSNFFIGNGSFIDDPLPSGYATNDPSQTTPINQSDPINNVFRGYLDLRGANGGVDFFDYDGSPKQDEHDFRFYNSVGTTRGSRVLLYSDVNDPAILVTQRVLDTQRQKYYNADPALHEYVVERTEGGEWLNYTRIFYSSNYYHVYLRYASGLAQQVFLDRIGAGPTTNSLGTFSVKSSCALGNFRYEPLLDNSGRMAVVNLSGTNVVRMTMALPQQNITKQETGLNYIAFVPALLLESAPQVTGPYSIETNASIDLGNRRITVPASGSVRFYRLRWDHSAAITSVKLVGGTVELTYQ